MLLDLDTNVEDDDGDNDVDETEFYVWNELRLHPLLMKAIYKLGFKEPTPIQKACIPAAAHQGKVGQGLSSRYWVTYIQMGSFDGNYCLFI